MNNEVFFDKFEVIATDELVELSGGDWVLPDPITPIYKVFKDLVMK